MTALELSIAFQTNKTPAEYVGLGRLVDGFEFDVVSVYHDLLFQPSLCPLGLLAARPPGAAGARSAEPVCASSAGDRGPGRFSGHAYRGTGVFRARPWELARDNWHSDVATDYPFTRMYRGGSLSTERDVTMAMLARCSRSEPELGSSTRWNGWGANHAGHMGRAHRAGGRPARR